MQGLCQGAFLPSLGGWRRGFERGRSAADPLVQALQSGDATHGPCGTQGQTIQTPSAIPWVSGAGGVRCLCQENLAS